MENYVKFMRGTPRAYEILRQKDEDTLYFIAEKDSLTGQLYLGEKYGIKHIFKWIKTCMYSKKRKES